MGNMDIRYKDVQHEQARSQPSISVTVRGLAAFRDIFKQL